MLAHRAVLYSGVLADVARCSSLGLQAFLEVQYRLYRSTIFHTSQDQEAVMLYRRKHRDDFLEHAALIPYRSAQYCTALLTRHRPVKHCNAHAL